MCRESPLGVSGNGTPPDVQTTLPRGVAPSVSVEAEGSPSRLQTAISPGSSPTSRVNSPPWISTWVRATFHRRTSASCPPKP